MNSQSSYISTFNNKISKKSFFIIFILSTLIILICSFLLNKNALFINENDLIKEYQFKKINNDNFKSINTLIIGDSSAGNAIDSKYFSKLSGLQTSNLALTGSWGIAGSLGMLKIAYEKNSNIKNVIIIQTLGIWSRSYPYEAVFKLYPFNEAISDVGLYKYIIYSFNPKVFWWNLKDLLKIIVGSYPSIDPNTDFLKQDSNRFSNNKKFVTFESGMQNASISNDKINEFHKLESFCIEKNLNCIYAYGPIHNSIYNQTKDYINKVNNFLVNNFHIKYTTNIFNFDNTNMGDNIDHIDPQYKELSTERYFNKIKNMLVK